MTKQSKAVLLISILASFVANVDGFIVQVALPTITRQVGGGLVTQQWVVDAYLITLGSLILIAGSLSDLFGRRRVLAWGLGGFGAASLVCALAPDAGWLIVGRALQGVAGALLVPSSLAIIMSTFDGPAEGRAIGIWTSWTSIAVLVGPLLGGLIVQVTSWRWVFGVVLIPIGFTLWLLRAVDLPDPPRGQSRLDWVGAVLGATALGLLVFGLIEQPHFGWTSARVAGPLLAGAGLLLTFIGHEARTADPMMPLGLFVVRNFWVGNVATWFVYAALGTFGFILTLYLQQVAHYPAVWSGLASIPATLVMFALASRFGALAGRFGPRWFMAGGPVVGAVGFALMLRVDATAPYWTQVFPAVLVFSLGLAATVAPLTAAILGDIEKRRSGIASAINNAVARIAGLIATASVGVVMGPQLNVAGFHRVMLAMAVLMVIGGLVSAAGIVNHVSAAKQ